MNMKEVLFEFDDICKELNIKYYLLQGTCLGLYRNHNFIQGDNDLDIFVDCSKEKLINLFEKLRLKKYEVERTFSNKFSNAPGEEINRHVLKGSVWIDVYFKMLDNRKRFMVDTNKIRFEGRTFNCPHQVEEYLALEFGEDWEIPCSQKSRGKGSELHEPSKGIEFEEIIKEEKWVND